MEIPTRRELVLDAVASMWRTGRWYLVKEICEKLEGDYNVVMSSKEVLNVLREMNPDFEIKRATGGHTAIFLPVNPK